jgi:uncharacterized protein YjbI with pentapeptide repeats
VQLQGADLWRADLQHVHLRKANLYGAELRYAALQGARLEGAQLQGARLQKAKLQEARLMETELQGANLWHAKLQRTNWWCANLREAILSEADMSDALLENTDMENATLIETQLNRAKLWDVSLQGAILRGANLHYSDLRRVDLSGADLVCAFLEHSDLRGANLQRARFEEAHLKNLYFSGVEGIAQVQLSTLKSAKSLNHLVAKNWRKAANNTEIQTFSKDDYALEPRPLRDLARDYGLLKLYFKQEGDLKLMSYYFLEEQRCMRKYYEQTGQQWERAKNWVLDTLYSYGESVKKLFWWSCVSIGITGSLLFLKDLVTPGVGLFWALSRFGTYTVMAGLSFALTPPGTLLALSGETGLWIASGEALLGKFFLALFAFVLGRKVER